MTQSSSKPAVGISACLLGERVRYDGGDKRHGRLLAEMEHLVEWVPVCPEVELGLGVPREKIQLIGGESGVRLITAETRRDVTDAMDELARRRVEELARAPIAGYVFKSGSPSCGVLRVKVFERPGDFDTFERRGRGRFAQALLQRMPGLPIEEDDRLQDPGLLAVFRQRVLRYAAAMSGLLFAFAMAGCERSRVVEPPVVSIAHPWSMFRGDPSHRGDRSSAPSPRWHVRWQAETGARIDASPLITADGRVIVVNRAGGIIALDRATGRPVTKTRAAAGIWSSPALADDVLITASSGGVVEARHLGDLNRVRWRRRVRPGPMSGISVADGVAYFCNGPTLLGIRGVDGRLVLRTALEANSFSVPAVDAVEGLVVVADRAGFVYAIETDSGTIRWRSATARGAHNDGSPAIGGGVVLVGSNSRALYGFRLRDGERVWRAASRGWVVSTPAVRDGVAYFGSDDDTLRAVRMVDGVQVWRASADGDIASSPTVIGDVIVHGAHDGKLHAFTLDGRRAHAPIDAGAAVYASVAVSPSGGFIAATHGGRVIAVD